MGIPVSHECGFATVASTPAQAKRVLTVHRCEKYLARAGDIVMRRWIARPDRRDAFLILIGALCLMLGYAYTAVPAPKVQSSLSSALNLVPLWVFGVAWLLVGGYCVLAAFVVRDIRGFTVAAFMPAAWGATYFGCWIQGDVGRGWVTSIIFGALAGAVFCVSGLIDPDPIAVSASSTGERT